jgi:hypothetical protein
MFSDFGSKFVGSKYKRVSSSISPKDKTAMYSLSKTFY